MGQISVFVTERSAKPGIKHWAALSEGIQGHMQKLR